MKNSIYILLIILLTTISFSCKQKNDRDNEITQLYNYYLDNNFHNYYEGTIGQANVHLFLTKKDKEIKGLYYYTKYNTEIEISGIINTPDTLLIKEYALIKDTKTNTGIWKLALNSEDELNGKWLSTDNSKTLDITLSKKELPPEKVKINKHYAHFVEPEEDSNSIAPYWLYIFSYIEIKTSNAFTNTILNQAISSNIIAYSSISTSNDLTTFLNELKASGNTVEFSTNPKKADKWQSKSHLAYYGADTDFYNNDIIVITYSYNGTSGGPYQYANYTVIYNLKDGSVVNYDDCFKPNYKTTLLEILKTNLKKQSEEDAPIEYERVNLDRNFGISEKGLTYSYSKYEITPGYYPAPYIVIPFNELKNLVKPEGPLGFILHK